MTEDPWTTPDAPGTRSIRKEVELDATPEAVWAAVATGPGTGCWFYPTQLEPFVGGRIAQSFGQDPADPGSEVVEAGTVTAYEPGRRLGAVGTGGEDGRSHAYEYLIEGRSGATTVLRFIHSGFSTDASFDAEYGTVDNGWDLFFGILRTYLAHFAGQPGTSGQAPAQHAGPPADAWARVAGALRPDVDLDGVAVGDAVTLAPEGMAPLSGTVELVRRGPLASGLAGDVLGLLLPDGLVRLAVEGPPDGPVSVWVARYGYGAEGVAAAEAAGPALNALMSTAVVAPPAEG